MILIDSAFKMGKNYFLSILEECKYIVQEKEVTRHITKDLQSFSDESDEYDEK